jgi:hypothetical protein
MVTKNYQVNIDETENFRKSNAVNKGIYIHFLHLSSSGKSIGSIPYLHHYFLSTKRNLAL